MPFRHPTAEALLGQLKFHDSVRSVKGKGRNGKFVKLTTTWYIGLTRYSFLQGCERETGVQALHHSLRK